MCIYSMASDFIASHVKFIPINSTRNVFSTGVKLKHYDATDVRSAYLKPDNLYYTRSNEKDFVYNVSQFPAVAILLLILYVKVCSEHLLHINLNCEVSCMQ